MAWHRMRGAPMSGEMGECYLICFRWPDGTKAWYRAPNGQLAGHYQGWTGLGDDRIQRHREGNGSRLCSVVSGAHPDIVFAVAEVRPGDRHEERRLKNLGGATSRCPMCQADISGEGEIT